MNGGARIEDVDVAFDVNGAPVQFKLKKHVYTKGTGFYNWGQLDDAELKVANGNIRGNVNFVFENGKESTGYYNNGFYLSVNPADSEIFGGFGIRVDMKIEGGVPFLDLTDIFQNEVELKKFFILRGDYSEDNATIIEIYKAQEARKLEKQRTENTISQEEFEKKINELNIGQQDIKKIAGIKNQLLSKARDNAVCDVIHAMGHEKLKELGVVGVMDSKNRPNWVCLVTDVMDHSVRFMDSSDFKLPSLDEELARLRTSTDEKLRKELQNEKDLTKRTEIETKIGKEWILKKLEIIKNHPERDWTTKVQLSDIFAIDAKIPIDAATLGKIKKLKDSLYLEPMTEKVIRDLLAQYRTGMISKSGWDPHDAIYLNPAEEMDNNIQNRVQKNSPPFIKTPLQDDLYKVIAKFLKQNPEFIIHETHQTFFERLEQTHQSGLELSEQELRTHFLRNGPTKDPFLKQLMYGLNFIDSSDYLRKMALGDGMPWAAYDPWGAPGHNLGKWQQAMKVSYRTKAKKMKPTEGLAEVFKIFSGDSQIKFRGHAVTAGGPFDKEGKLMTGDTSEGQGYFRVTAEQLEVLRGHTFIKNIDAIQVDTAVEGAGYIVRYDYPDARDYEKLKSLAPKFYEAIQSEIATKGQDEVDILLSQVLPSTLAGQLANDGKDPLSPDCIDPQYHFSVKFTSMLIGELFTKLDDLKISAETRYQLMLTLHPFFDTNGRCARAFYQIETGNPFMLKNWDFDILYSPKQLKKEIDAGISDWARFVGEWKKESTQAYKEHRAPSFYAQPQMWLRNVGIDPNKYTSDDQKHIIYKLQEVFKSDRFFRFQEKKAWFDCQALVKQELKPVLDKINAPKLEEEAKFKPQEAQRMKVKKLEDEIRVVKVSEKEAKVGGVVITGSSAGLQKLQMPEQVQKMKKVHKRMDRKAEITWRKDHALTEDRLNQSLGAKVDGAEEPDIIKGAKRVADFADLKGTKYSKNKTTEDIRTLAITMRNILNSQQAITKDKVKSNLESNLFRRTFVNYFYASYINDLDKTTKFLVAGSQLIENFIENLKKAESEESKEPEVEFNILIKNITTTYKRLGVNEAEIGTNIKNALKALEAQTTKISNFKAGLTKKK